MQNDWVEENTRLLLSSGLWVAVGMGCAVAGGPPSGAGCRQGNIQSCYLMHSIADHQEQTALIKSYIAGTRTSNEGSRGAYDLRFVWLCLVASMQNMQPPCRSCTYYGVLGL
jgi:hypothetical protein